MIKNKKNAKSMSLSTKILIALVIGAITGAVLFYFVPSGTIKDDIIMNGVLYFLSQAFLRLLLMIVVPLVFFSLATGALAMGDPKSLGRVGVKTLLFYLLTTAIAIFIGLGLAQVFQPGQGLDITTAQSVEVAINEAPSAVDTILNIIPENPFGALAQGNMLQIILFALLLGIICANLPDKLQTVTKILNEGNDLMMAMTNIVMKVAPLGVFAMVAKTFADTGFDSVASMATYMISLGLGLVLQVGVVYIPLFLIFTRLNVFKFIKKFAQVAVFAFSSNSSAATIPVTLNACDDMGIPRKISAFTIPLGATVNMDGTAIMMGTAVVFVANAYGIELSAQDYMTVILTATLASIGTAGVPGVGMVTLSMVLTSVGLPVAGIALIMGVDKLMEMPRTAVNVTGDTVVTLIGAKTEGMLDEDQYNSVDTYKSTDEF